jgi:hypothetical protein
VSPAKPSEEQREIAQLRAQVAMLTDTVVMAACLWFNQFESSSERDYASEVLHSTATELVNANPRLNGAFKGVPT